MLHNDIDLSFFSAGSMNHDLPGSASASCIGHEFYYLVYVKRLTYQSILSSFYPLLYFPNKIKNQMILMLDLSMDQASH